MNRLLLSMIVFSIAALGADINGTWRATADGPNGNMERTFLFKVDANKLTGETTSSMVGKSTISDGKVDGDNLSFTITAKIQDNEVKISYKGKVTGDQIHLTSEIEGGGGGQAFEWTGKRVQ